MFKNLNIKKLLSSFVSMALLFSCAQTTNANSIPPEKSTSNFLENVKSVVSSPKFIVPTAIVGALSLAVATPIIYSKIKYDKPRNPEKNNIIGVTDEKVKKEYFACYYATYTPNATIHWSAYNNKKPERSMPISACNTTVEQKINEIVEEMNKYGFTTDFEKAVFMHDYIYDHYNTKNLPCNCLLGGKGDSTDVATAYMILLTRAGVECRMVTGPNLYRWNIVKINGQWYHVDVTRDLSLKATHGRYKWFMLSEEEILKDHYILYND